MLKAVTMSVSSAAKTTRPVAAAGAGKIRSSPRGGVRLPQQRRSGLSLATRRPAARTTAKAEAAAGGAAAGSNGDSAAADAGDYLVGEGPPVVAEAEEKQTFLAMCFSKFCFLLQLPEPLKKFTLPAQIFMWFSMYMCYNLVSKSLLNTLPMPLTLHSAFNLICVTCSLLTLAAVETARATPGMEGMFKSQPAPPADPANDKGPLPNLRLKELLSTDISRSWRQGALHATTHAASMAAISGASLCYAHTAKATEPLFAALIAAFFFGKKLALKVWMSLIPIIGGVAYASFTPGGGGMDAKVAYALTAAIICSSTLAFHQASIKSSMKEDLGATPVAGSPLRVYARALLRAAPIAFGIAVVMEGSKWGQAGSMLASASAAMGGTSALVGAILMGGLSFFLYNQLALICLESLSPLSSSIGNVLKRVFVVAVNVSLMGGAVTDRQLTGFGIAMFGVMCYSLASKSSPQQDKAEETKQEVVTTTA